MSKSYYRLSFQAIHNLLVYIDYRIEVSKNYYRLSFQAIHNAAQFSMMSVRGVKELLSSFFSSNSQREDGDNLIQEMCQRAIIVFLFKRDITTSHPVFDLQTWNTIKMIHVASYHNQVFLECCSSNKHIHITYRYTFLFQIITDFTIFL